MQTKGVDAVEHFKIHAVYKIRSGRKNRYIFTYIIHTQHTNTHARTGTHTYTQGAGAHNYQLGQMERRTCRVWLQSEVNRQASPGTFKLKRFALFGVLLDGQ